MKRRPWQIIPPTYAMGAFTGSVLYIGVWDALLNATIAFLASTLAVVIVELHGAADALINLGAVCPECGAELLYLPEWRTHMCGRCWIEIEFTDNNPLGDPE